MDTPITAPNRLAYDCGMHNGDDAAYYLFKGYNVVAIEADPILCEQANKRLQTYIDNGRLTILNIAIGASSGTSTFSVHEKHPVLSTLEPRQGEDWRSIEVQVRPLSAVVTEYGAPDLIKIDIEGHDLVAIRDLKQHAIRPPVISAEAHEIYVVDELISWGYQRFKLIPCARIGILPEFTDLIVRRIDGSTDTFTFKPHSAGPVGDDAPGEWMNADDIKVAWLIREQTYGHGWFDVQASLS